MTAPPPSAKSSSEAIYLHEQAANAKAAFKQTLREITSGLGEGVSVKGWTKLHPWVMVSSAAVAGFTAACLAVPSHEQQELRREAAIRRALNPEPPKKSEPVDNGKPPRKSFLASIAGDAIKAAGSILASSIMAGAGQASQPPPGGNGTHVS